MAITPAMTGMSGMSGMTGGFLPSKLSNLRQWFLDNSGYRSSELNGIPVLDSKESYGTYRQPRQGRCYNFDNTDDRVDLPAAVNTMFSQANDFSIGISYIHSAATGHIFSSFNSSTDRFVIEDTGSSLRCNAYDGTSNGASTTTTLVNGTVYRIFLSWVNSTSTLSLWIDSTLQTGTLAGSLGAGAPAAYLGVLTSLTSNWGGNLWDVRCYNSALSDPADEATTAPTFLYHCNEESGLTAYDSSGNGADGTLTNITQSTFHATDTGVTSNPANEVGYSESGAVIVPRDESDTDNDVLGNPLDYTGKTPYPAQVNTPCVTLDGTDDYIAMTNTVRDVMTTASDWSIALKVYVPTGAAGGDMILSVTGAVGNDRAGIEYNGSAIRCGVWDGAWIAKSGAFSLDTWHEIVMIYDASPRGLTVYVDGAALAGSTSPTSNGTVAANIGALTAGTLALDGRIADVRIFNSKLASEAEARTVTPTHYYPMQEGAGNIVYDVGSTGGEHGTITNAALSDFWANTTNDVEDHSILYGGQNILFFNGTSDYVRLDSAITTGTTFSIAAWVYLPSSTSFSFIINNTGATIGLIYRNGSNKFSYYFSSSDHLSDTALPSGWVHVVFSVSSGTGTFYVDGTADGTVASVPTADLQDVGGKAAGGASFSGPMYDIRVYSDALSSTEAQYLASNGASGDDPGTDNLTLHLKFDGDATDSSASGNDGTLNGPSFAFVGADPSAGTVYLGGEPSPSRVANKLGNVNSEIDTNPYTAAELNALGAETDYALTDTRQDVSPNDTKFRRTDTDGDDRFFTVDTALTGANKTDAEAYVS